MVKAQAEDPLVINDHMIELIEAGEEWDTTNEVICHLYQAQCSGCKVHAKPARTKAGAIKRFRREYQYCGLCEAVPRQQTFDLSGGG